MLRQAPRLSILYLAWFLIVVMQMTIGVSRNWSGTRLAYCTMLLLYSHLSRPCDQDAMESVWTWSGNRDIRMTIPLSYFMTGWSWLCFDSSVQSPQTSWCIYHCIAFCREEEACFYNGWLWMGTRTRWGEIEVKCSCNPCKQQNLLAVERGVMSSYMPRMGHCASLWTGVSLG